MLLVPFWAQQEIPWHRFGCQCAPNSCQMEPEAAKLRLENIPKHDRADQRQSSGIPGAENPPVPAPIPSLDTRVKGAPPLLQIVGVVFSAEVHANIVDFLEVLAEHRLCCRLLGARRHKLVANPTRHANSLALVLMDANAAT